MSSVVVELVSCIGLYVPVRRLDRGGIRFGIRIGVIVSIGAESRWGKS